MSMKFFKKIYNNLFTVEMVLKKTINDNNFEKNQVSHFFKKLVNHPSTTCGTEWIS